MDDPTFDRRIDLSEAWRWRIGNIPKTEAELHSNLRVARRFLGEYAAETRIRHNLSLGQLGHAINMSRQDIRDLLNGVGRWPDHEQFQLLLALMAATDAPIDQLQILVGMHRTNITYTQVRRMVHQGHLPPERLMDAVSGVLETPTTLVQWMEEHMTQTTPVAPSPAPVPTPASLPATPPEAPAPPANLPLTGSPFHAALWFARTAAGLTVDELAARVGVHNSSVHGWEANATTPIHMHYTKLCEVLPALKQARAPGSRDIPKPGRATGSVVGPASGQVAPAPLEGSLASLRGARQLIALLKTVNDSAEYPDFVRLLEKASSEGMTVAEVLELFAV